MILRNCDMKSFVKRCEGKKLICYGIGKEFQRMLKGYQDYGWIDNIVFLADGNPAREGENVFIRDKKYLIHTQDAMRRNITGEMILMITCMGYAEVIKELDCISELDCTECYLFHFMFSMSEGRDYAIRRIKEALLPKVIHYCWFGKKEKPDLYQKCIESWRRYCPDYEIIEWNEENCNIEENLYAKQAYERGKYGFVPDYFRLKIIYEYGGIYLDTDVEILKSINDLRYNRAFGGLEFPGEANLGLGFGAVKGHSVIKKMLKRYDGLLFQNPDGSCNETASPIYQSEDLRQCGMTEKNVLQEVEGMTVYPCSVLSPQNVYTGITIIEEESYMWHHFDASWISGERLKQKKKRQADAEAIWRRIRESEENF